MVGRPVNSARCLFLDATARVFLAQDTFTQAMSAAYRQQLTAQILEREEERSALVEALLSHRITDSQSLWEAADLLRLPTSGPYVVVAAELPAIGKLGLPTIENRLAVRDIRSAWRLLPDLQVGIVALRGHAAPASPVPPGPARDQRKPFFPSWKSPVRVQRPMVASMTSSSMTWRPSRFALPSTDWITWPRTNSGIVLNRAVAASVQTHSDW